ncbi:NYN domain-containing protein [Microbispora rosea]|uniref:NYN domain-containing protein n=1 Tax=Microbispora rosea TaxID=58117 RepID=UPI003435968E
MITNVYVDGFNLYYGCLKGTPYKWLDLDALSRRLLPRDDIRRIRYFTARTTPRTGHNGHIRQEIYHRALATIPHLSIHLGYFQQTITRMPLAYPQPGGPTTVEVIKTEEKGSDVNLAAHLIADAFLGDCDIAVVISNDGDLAEPIRIVRHQLGLPVGVLNPFPVTRRARALERVPPTFFKQIRPSELRVSQFPVVVHDQHGKITRPFGW